MNRPRRTLSTSRRPLPAKLDRLIQPPKPRSEDNLGLHLDKFIPRDATDWSLKGELRREQLQRFSGDWSRPFAAEALIRRLNGMTQIERPPGATVGAWYRSAEEPSLKEHTLLLCRLEANVESRLIVDYGRQTAMEGGLSFHPILGVPRVPGSALKGITSAWLLETEGARDPALGQDPKEQGGAYRGVVDFLDALPKGGHFSLALDVLTPHYGEYYRGNSAPGDWLSPIPFTFLTVAKPTRFLFDLLAKYRDQAALVRIAQILAEALEEHGVGAKTAAGYGYFEVQR